MKSSESLCAVLPNRERANRIFVVVGNFLIFFSLGRNCSLKNDDSRENDELGK